MNPPDPQAEAVWQSTLPQIRATRRNRRNRRIAGVAAACFAFALWPTPRSPTPDEKPTASIEPEPRKTETIAVMRVDENGSIRLEEIASTELGGDAFSLGQIPILHSEWPYQ